MAYWLSCWEILEDELEKLLLFLEGCVLLSSEASLHLMPREVRCMWPVTPPEGRGNLSNQSMCSVKLATYLFGCVCTTGWRKQVQTEQCPHTWTKQLGFGFLMLTTLQPLMFLSPRDQLSIMCFSLCICMSHWNGKQGQEGSPEGSALFMAIFKTAGTC